MTSSTGTRRFADPLECDVDLALCGRLSLIGYRSAKCTQKRSNFGRRHRPCEIISLGLVAAHGAKEFELVDVLDAFGNDLHAHAGAQRQDG